MSQAGGSESAAACIDGCRGVRASFHQGTARDVPRTGPLRRGRVAHSGGSVVRGGIAPGSSTSPRPRARAPTRPDPTMSGRIATEIAQNAPIPSTSVELVLNLRRTARTIDAWLDRVLAPGELRIEEFNILRILRGAGEAGHSRAEVERRLVAGADKLTVALFQLRSRALIAGTSTLRITAAGREVLTRVDDEVAEAIRAMGAGLPDEQMRTAIDVLERIRERISS